jgi:hypothetical protein
MDTATLIGLINAFSKPVGNVVNYNLQGIIGPAGPPGPPGPTGLGGFGPPGTDATELLVYYIKPTNGTAIKNGTGTLTVEAHRIFMGEDELLSAGTVKLYDPSNNEITVANGYATGSDGYTGVLDATDIDLSKVITLKDGPSGQALDTITLIDVLDGAAGSDAIFGSIESNNGLAWVQEAGPGNWNPTATTSTLTVTFYQSGASIATRTVVITRADATLSAPTPDTVDGITYTRIGDGTSAITIVFTHVSSGIQVSETLYAVAGAPAGSALSADIPFLSGIIFTGDTGTGKVGWSAGTLKYGGDTYSIVAKAVGDGDTNLWIYWDADDSNTTFKTTNTLSTAIASGNWVMCYNDAGVAIPTPAYRSLRAGLGQFDTLAAINAALGAITSGSITLSLGGDTRLRIDSNGLYVSNNAGGAWTAVIKNVAGVVGLYADTLVANAITTNMINGLAVDNSKIADDSTMYSGISNTDAESSALSKNPTWDTLDSFATTSDGGIVIGSYSLIFHNYDTTWQAFAQMRIVRDSTEIVYESHAMAASPPDDYTIANTFMDTPTAGAHTYYLQGRYDSVTPSLVCKARLRKLYTQESRGK